MAKYDYFERLKGSLEQAIAFEEGDRTKARVTVREIPVPKYSADDVKRLRISLNLSQHSFALVLGVSPRTIGAWELGRNAPSGSARHLLFLIDNNNNLVEQLTQR